MAQYTSAPELLRISNHRTVSSLTASKVFLLREKAEHQASIEQIDRRIPEIDEEIAVIMEKIPEPTKEPMEL